MKHEDEHANALQGWIDEGRILRSEGATSISLTRAVANRCGAASPEPADPAARELSDAIGDSEHYLFVLVDGLGMNQQHNFPAGGFFGTHFSRSLRSVFPSTTAAALTSLYSGLWPAQHGVVGWFTHLPDHGETIIPLRAVERFSERSLEQMSIDLAEVIEGESLFPSYRRECRTYTLRKFKSGPFADWANDGVPREGYRNLRNAVKRVKRNLQDPGEPSFSYLYYSEVDHLSHEHGWDAQEVVREIRDVDRQLKRIRAILPDSVRMIVTADHGHINVPQPKHELLYPGDPLLALLECPPSGESRIPLFHVKPGEESRFRDAFSDRFHTGFVLVSPGEAEELGLYGPLPLSATTRARIGTYLAVSPEADAIEFVYEEGGAGVGHIGMHGGMSHDEVEIPLFLA